MKKYIDIFLINLVSLIIGICTYYFIDRKVEILAAILVTGVSLSLGIRQYRTENDKLFKELFQEFNFKYDQKYNALLNKIDEYETSGRDYVLSEEEKGIIIDYLNFCSEEYLWYYKNRIPKEVWNSWENGMVYFLNLSPINKIVLQQKDQMNSFYGLFDEIGATINNMELV